MQLKDILQIEDTGEHANARCCYTGIPLWPPLRYLLFSLIIKDSVKQLIGTTSKATSLASPSTIRKAFYAGSATIANLRRMACPSSQVVSLPRVVIMTSSVADILVDGVWVNRLSDYFWSLSPDSTTVLEDIDLRPLVSPRWNPRTLYNLDRHLHSLWLKLSRYKGNDCVIDRLFSLSLERAKHLLGWEPPTPQLSQNLLWGAKKRVRVYPFVYHYHRSVFRALAPKIILMLTACYGDRAPRVAAAKSLGIPVAEYQHGIISSGHFAYNFAERIRESTTYRNSLPDFFLAYGKWWSDQINAPLVKVPIGNPHFSRSVKDPSRGKNILLLAGDNFERTAKLAVFLESSTDFQIVIRPHPGFIPQALAWKSPSKRIEIDGNQNLYDSFSESQVLISECSTGLFEGVAMVPKVLIWETRISRFALGKSDFDGFSTFSECRDKLLRFTTNGNEERIDFQKYWETDWELNYTNFIEKAAIS